jgi:hypothetical protein
MKNFLPLGCLLLILSGCSLSPKESNGTAATSNPSQQPVATKPAATNSDLLQTLFPSLDGNLVPAPKPLGLPQPTIPSASANSVDGSGLLLDDAHKKSRELLPGMSQAKVKELLGEPDDVSAMPVGGQTAHPWNAVIWRYVWKTSPYRGSVPSVTTFITVFEKSDEGWIVNSFLWYP